MLKLGIGIIMSIVFLSTVSMATEPPKFYKGQNIKYEVGFFLHKMCSGKGVIDDYDSDTRMYTIFTPMEDKGCPFRLEKYENQITNAE